MSQYDVIEAAARDGAWEPCLEHALEAWRADRDPQTAALIDVLGRRCPGPPPAPDSLAQLQRWWTFYARHYRASDVSSLACLLFEGAAQGDVAWASLERRHGADSRVLTAHRAFAVTPKWRNFVDRLGCIAQWPHDPRTTRMLATAATMLARERSRDDTELREALVATLGQLLVELRDVRAVAWLDAPKSTAALGEVSRALVDANATPVSVSDVDRAAIARVHALAEPSHASPPTGSEPALWLEIAAHPLDDAPREVLADLLLTRDDQRGRMIRLQCSARPSDAAQGRSIADTRAREWLSDLSDVVALRECKFRRGFLDTVAAGGDLFGKAPPTSKLDHATLLHLRGHRELSTVSTLRVWSATIDDWLALAGLCPALQRCSFSNRFDEARVRELPMRLGIRALEYRFDLEARLDGPWLSPRLATLAEHLPHIEEIQLDRLHYGDTRSLVDCVPRLRLLFPKLRRIVIDGEQPLRPTYRDRPPEVTALGTDALVDMLDLDDVEAILARR